jgi:hypothetical protein
MPKPMFQGGGFLSTAASKYQNGSAPALHLLKCTCEGRV